MLGTARERLLRLHRRSTLLASLRGCQAHRRGYRRLRSSTEENPLRSFDRREQYQATQSPKPTTLLKRPWPQERPAHSSLRCVYSYSSHNTTHRSMSSACSAERACLRTHVCVYRYCCLYACAYECVHSYVSARLALCACVPALLLLLVLACRLHRCA